MTSPETGRRHAESVRSFVVAERRDSWVDVSFAPNEQHPISVTSGDRQYPEQPTPAPIPRRVSADEEIDVTDQRPDSTNPEMGSTSGDSFAWTEPEASTTDRGEKAREWLAQLQAMIENLATQAAPVVRDIGAKAAELAAIAGEKAGPVAQRAAEITGQAGQKLAERSRDLATELRRDAAAAKAKATGTADEVADVPADVAEDLAESAPSTPSGVA